MADRKAEEVHLHNDKIDPTSSSDEESTHVQEGIKAIEATAQAWSRRGLYIAYAGLFLMQQSIYLDQYALISAVQYATSAFNAANLVSTVTFVQSVVLACVKTPVARLSDVFGRFELYCVVILIYVLGYIMDASSKSFNVFAAAQIFYSFGNGGQQALQQIFIADTTDLANRALFSALPYLIAVWSAFAGPQITSAVVGPDMLGPWRWVYGIFAITLPVCFLPFALSLFLNKRKAKKLGLYKGNLFRKTNESNRNVGERVKTLQKVLVDLDIVGIILFVAFAALILLPLNLAPSNGGFNQASYIAMLVVGGCSLVAFIAWERMERYNPRPFFPKEIFQSRTAVAGFAIAFFYFFAFYMSVYPYYYQFLQVTFGTSSSATSYILETFTLASSPAAVVTGLLIKYTGHIKYWITLGTAIYATGIGLLIRYRQQGTSVGSLVGLQIMIGIGAGILNIPTQCSIQMSVSHQQVAAVTAIYLTLLEIGGAVGNAVSGAVFNSLMPGKLQAYLPEAQKPQAAELLGAIATTTLTSYPLGTPTRDALARAYQETINILLIIAVCIAAITFPLSLVGDNHKIYQMDQKVSGRVIGGMEKTMHRPEMENPVDPAAGDANLARSRRPWPFNRTAESRRQ